MGNANVNSRTGQGHHESSHPIAGPDPRGGGGSALHHDGAESSNRPGGGPMAYVENMLQSPPDSPVSRSPLMFTPQIPMAPITRVDEFVLGPYQPGLYEQRGRESLRHQERGIPTMIVWTYGGNSVSVEGSWDNWSTREPMQKVGKDFTLVKMLPSGVYQYKIILDKDWHYPEEAHSHTINVLDVQDYVPENLDSVAGFEPPLSPPASYNDMFPNPEDFAKEPPAVPSHLHLTLLNVPPGEEAMGTLPRPQHVTLNHLYVEKGRNLRSVLAIGSTHRYRSKYVTVALYKPIRK